MDILVTGQKWVQLEVRESSLTFLSSKSGRSFSPGLTAKGETKQLTRARKTLWLSL